MAEVGQCTDTDWQAAAIARMNAKAKPPGSLGLLEQWAVKLCALQGCLQPQVNGACLLLFAADNGVTKTNPEVSAYPRQVTPAMFGAIAKGQAASSVLCTANSCHLLLTDVGVDGDVSGITPQQHSHIAVSHKKVAPGSSCFVHGPAMTPQQCEAAMQAGAGAVRQACRGLSKAAHGASAPSQSQVSGGSMSHSSFVLCIGELGIGNTTAAAAVLAGLTGAAPDEVCGRGTGVNDAGLAAKQAAVAAALSINQHQISSGPLQALQAVGGLDLAAMAGAYLEAAAQRMPVIVDGFVSGVAALVAARLDPVVRQCLFLSHRSAELGTQLLVEQLGGDAPVLDMGMRLGEGTGAVLCLPLLRSAAAVMTDMAALEDVLAGQS